MCPSAMSCIPWRLEFSTPTRPMSGQALMPTEPTDNKKHFAKKRESGLAEPRPCARWVGCSHYLTNDVEGRQGFTILQARKLRSREVKSLAQVKSHSQEVEEPEVKAGSAHCRAQRVPPPPPSPCQVSSREQLFAAIQNPWVPADCSMGYILPKERNTRLDKWFPDGS